MSEAKPENKAAATEPDDKTVTVLTSDKLIERLRRALSRDGDFPASAKIVNELKQLTSDPNTTANQLTEIILQEPSLGTRILSLVNSSFYRRGKPIMTISQAVIQVGMKPLADLCAGLVLLQKFVPTARRDSAFAASLRRLVITSLLSSSINTETAKGQQSSKNEAGYLVGSLAEMGSLLLAYYFPRIFEAAVKRSEIKKQDIAQSVKDLTGLSPIQLSIEVANALRLPDFYRHVLVATHASISGIPDPGAQANPTNPTERSEVQRIAQGLYAAHTVSAVVSSGGNKETVEAVLAKVKSKVGIDPKLISSVLINLPSAFTQQCSGIELSLPPLPEYISTLGTNNENQAPAKPVEEKDQFFHFVDEIRQAVENGDPTASIITTVMETLAWSLKFDRVLLLLLNASKTQMSGRMLLGQGGSIDPKKIFRPIGSDASPQAPDNLCFIESRPIFHGLPIFEGGWPLVALPIGFGSRAVGVIYADRLSTSNAKELGNKEQAAITVLAELLNQSIQINS